MKKSPLTVSFEYAAIRFFCALVNAVPYSAAAFLARGLGWAAFRVFGFKRRRTLDRIRGAFPGLSTAAATQIAVRSLQNVLLTGVEMMRAPSLTRTWMDRHIVNGPHYRKLLDDLSAEGNGVVVMVPHMGNWYMAAWAMAAYGHPLFALAARQRNPKIDAWMHRQYGSVEILDRGARTSLVQIKDRLQAGKAFAILPDLRVPHPDVTVDFLGGQANVSHAGAMFAVRCGSPILVATARREGSRHVFTHLATLRPDSHAADPKAEAIRLTREVFRYLDDAVRANPGDWYWFNKRWILQPVTERKAP